MYLRVPIIAGLNSMMPLLGIPRTRCFFQKPVGFPKTSMGFWNQKPSWIFQKPTGWSILPHKLQYVPSFRSQLALPLSDTLCRSRLLGLTKFLQILDEQHPQEGRGLLLAEGDFHLVFGNLGPEADVEVFIAHLNFLSAEPIDPRQVKTFTLQRWREL